MARFRFRWIRREERFFSDFVELAACMRTGAASYFVLEASGA